jgi:hypothetical protein
MTKPGFYTDDEWTGYTSMTPGDNSHAWVDGFGGGHPDLSTVDRTIRFHLFEQSNMLKYTLTSEFKRTQFSNFKVTVDRATGHLKLCWTDSLKKSCYTVDAVITPFGIVGRRTSYGNWIWLWKCKWSEYDMIV